MADTKISALTAATTLADTDELVIASAGASKKITGANLKASENVVKLFDSIVTGADAASIDTGASAIPAGYAKLVVDIYARSDKSATFSEQYLQFNGDTGANYNWERLAASGIATTTTSQVLGDNGFDFMVTASVAAANFFTPVSFVIPNYDGTVGYKATNYTDGVGDTTGSNQLLNLRQGYWKSTAAINQIKVLAAFGGTQKFKIGSRMTIYGYR